MAQPIYDTLDDLSRRGMTLRMMKVCDWVIPGKYVNVVGFEETIRFVTGETDQDYIQQIGERAIELYNDPKEGYQRALWLYQTCDSVQGLAGFASFLSKVGEDVGFLGFFRKLLPKEDTTQAVDLGIKLVTEIVAFCTLNGIPGDSVGDFVESLQEMENERLMRMGTLVAVDGILPLGPDFIEKAYGMLEKTGASGLASNERFARMSGMIPGRTDEHKLGFVKEGLNSIRGWAGDFVAKNDISQNRVLKSINGLSEKIEGKLDYAAAFIDMTTDYFEHTGTQSVGRSL
ncbi:MAG: hypothetical protein AAF907_14485, partial [Planctomycetota bacterium]